MLLLYSFDGICKFGVIEKFSNDCLEYRKCKEGSLLLHENIHKIDTSQLIKIYKFNFVNVFHSDIALMKEKFLHHCLVNKLGYVEGMLKPSIHVDAAPSSDFLSNSQMRMKKRKEQQKRCTRSGGEYVDSSRRRSTLHKEILSNMESYWHTIYVKNNFFSSYQELCRKKGHERGYYIMVPDPTFNRLKEEWITFQSGFRYCYREHFIIDARYFESLKEIKRANEMYLYLLEICVGSTLLVQPDDCSNIRFCMVDSHQHKSLKEKEGIEILNANGNEYLYEFSNLASWSLKGCVVSSWETDGELPEFSFDDVKRLVGAVGRGAERERTKNKGVYLTLGPRYSGRPRPSPVIQDKTKLQFCDFHRQDWKSQEAMYLLRKKVCYGAERIRQRSVALNPGYMHLVGCHCCGRQLLTSGFYKEIRDGKGHTIGFVNSLHDDTCNLIKKNLVALYIRKFTEDINNCKKYYHSKKKKLIKKVKEINNLIGLGLPTTCAYNIISDVNLLKVARLSSLFVMFDFAMTLSHKTVHNFFGWAFSHCTALPILIFHDGIVHVSNDGVEEKHCIIVFAWGSEGGKAESRFNTNMKNLQQNEEDANERDAISNWLVERLSTM